MITGLSTTELSKDRRSGVIEVDRETYTPMCFKKKIIIIIDRQAEEDVGKAIAKKDKEKTV